MMMRELVALSITPFLLIFIPHVASSARVYTNEKCLPNVRFSVRGNALALRNVEGFTTAADTEGALASTDSLQRVFITEYSSLKRRSKP